MNRALAIRGARRDSRRESRRGGSSGEATRCGFYLDALPSFPLRDPPGSLRSLFDGGLSWVRTRRRNGDALRPVRRRFGEGLSTAPGPSAIFSRPTPPIEERASRPRRGRAAGEMERVASTAAPRSLPGGALTHPKGEGDGGRRSSAPAERPSERPTDAPGTRAATGRPWLGCMDHSTGPGCPLDRPPRSAVRTQMSTPRSGYKTQK